MRTDLIEKTKRVASRSSTLRSWQIPKYDVGPFYIQLSSCKDNEGASNSAEEDDVDQEEGRSHLLYNNSDDSDQGDYDLADDDEGDYGENEDDD